MLESRISEVLEIHHAFWSAYKCILDRSFNKMENRKNIIFIGLTQNGKSSLVKQIHLYAKYTKTAEEVRIGGGNLSETQYCSTYQVKL